jgi:hypothetical protein
VSNGRAPSFSRCAPAIAQQGDLAEAVPPREPDRDERRAYADGVDQPRADERPGGDPERQDAAERATARCCRP